MVIDAGGEVAGAGPVPHACIGKARRVPVRNRAGQAAAMLEAVQNHAPQVCNIPSCQCSVTQTNSSTLDRSVSSSLGP